MQEMEFSLTFRCYYPEGNHTDHRQKLPLKDIPKWIECYQFTHPHCSAITVKVWLSDLEK